VSSTFAYGFSNGGTTYNQSDAAYDRGYILTLGYVFYINPSTKVCTVAGTGLRGAYQIIIGWDFSIIAVTISAFSIQKYLPMSIMGVSQQSIAAGNTGTNVLYSHGGGAGKNGYPCNSILGTVGKSFDHSAATIVGNKGTLLGSSVALEGVI